MRYETIAVDVSPRGVATILLNRPERSNALNPRMLAELARASAALGGDDAVRLLVLRGAGRHFCAGADVSGEGRDANPDDTPISLTHMVLGLDAVAKPVIAVVQGACLGGGLALVACCDVVLAEEGAFFAIPEARLGLAPSGLVAVFLRAIGYRNFRRYGLSGERIPAAEALRIGLVNEVRPTAQLDAALEEVCDALLHAAPGSIGAHKAMAARFAPLGVSAEEVEALEESFRAGLKTPEAVEGLAAFREKRKPSWYRP